MKLYKPSRSASKTSVKAPKFSSRSIKPFRLSSSKTSIKVPKISKGRTVKVKL